MKILVIQLYQTGDVVLSTHIPRELHKFLDNPHVDFLTFESNRAVLENNQYINNILTIKRSEGLWQFVKFLQKIRNLKYDAVIDLHNNPRSAYITFASGAGMRITYSTTKRKLFYNCLPERLAGKAGQIKLSLLRPLIPEFRLDMFDFKPEIFTSEKSRVNICNLLSEKGINDSDFLVTMSPTHKKNTRRWKFRHFIDTAEYLRDRYNAKIIITYGPGELQYITDNMPEIPNRMFLMPSLGLDDFCALVEKAKLHIGNDSAPHHIATALNVPTFIVIGSSNDGWVYGGREHTSKALGMDCQPCGKSECRISEDIPCMNTLSFEMIKSDLDRFIIQNNICSHVNTK
jgi:ADP-heptose:LPS heptosyltransferase